MSEKREDIIQTTCRLMEIQGYHATGLNQILKESEAPKGSLYHYFPEGKEELMEAAILRKGQMVEEQIRNQLEETEDPAEAIHSFVMTLADYVAESEYKQGGPLTTLASEVAGISDRLTDACNQVYQSWEQIFKEKLSARIDSEMQVNRLASLIICSIEGGIILCRTEESPEPMQDIAEELFILIEHHTG